MNNLKPRSGTPQPRKLLMVAMQPGPTGARPYRSKVHGEANRPVPPGRGVAMALLLLVSLPAGAQLMEPQLLAPLNPPALPANPTSWTLGPELAPAPAPGDVLVGNNGVQNTIRQQNIADFADYIRGQLLAKRTVKDPLKAYSIGSDRTLTISFTTGAGPGKPRLYLNTYAKGELGAAAQGSAMIADTVQVQDMTAIGNPVVLQGIPDQNPPLPPGFRGPPPPPNYTWKLTQGATGVNKFQVGWLNQAVDLDLNRQYTITEHFTGNAGPIPINTTGADRVDLFKNAEDQYLNLAFNIAPPIPAGRTDRNPQWRTTSGIRSTLSQQPNKVRNGVTLNGQNVKIGMIESGNPINNHVDLPSPARLQLINAAPFAVGPQFRSEHATAVAGIIAAGNAHGVAPASSLYSVSMNSAPLPAAPPATQAQVGQAVVNNFQSAINQLVNNNNVSVVNVSWGPDPATFPDAFTAAMNRAVNLASQGNKNVVFVAAVDDNGTSVNVAGAPASATEAIGVGALDYTLGKVVSYSASFVSQGGDPPSLCAPGQLIDSTVVVPMKNSLSQWDAVNPPSSYDWSFYGFFQNGRGSSPSQTIDGTSFAAPMVCGAVALWQQLVTAVPALLAAEPKLLDPELIRSALMTTAWKTKADGVTALYYKDGVTKYIKGANLGKPGGPVNQRKGLWEDMGAGWLDVYDFLQQASTRDAVKKVAALGGGGGGGFAAGTEPSDNPGSNPLANMTLTGPRTLDTFTVYPQQQQEYDIPVSLGMGDSLAVTVVWPGYTNATQNLDLAIALYQNESGSTNGNPNLIPTPFVFDASNDVVLPTYLGADPLIAWANGGWSTAEHLYYEIDSQSQAGQYYLRVINLSTNTDTFSFSAWVKSATNYPGDIYTNQEFNLTGVAEAGGTISPAGVVESDPGSNVTFTATAAPGFVLDQWLLDGVAMETNTPSLTVTNVQADHTVTVTFQIANTALDLSVDTESLDTRVAVGSNVVFYLPVQNQGPANASNVSVTDLIPPGTTFVSAQASQGTCSFDPTHQTLTCLLGELDATNTALVTLTVTAPDSPGTISNAVSVTNDVFDAVLANNSATSTVSVVEMITVDATSDTNGVIYPAGEFNVLGGQAQLFSAVPDTNYLVESWQVNGVDVQAGGTNFLLLDIQSNEVVSVVFAPLPVALPNDFPAPVDKGSWFDPDGGAHPWKVGLATWKEAPIYDDQFAGQATLLAKRGVLMHFAFAECFGGGMLQNLAAIPVANLQVSGTSAAQWNQAAYYREPRYTLAPLPVPNNHNVDWADTYTSGAGGNNNALVASFMAWNADPFRLGTLVRPNPSGPDESFPFFETAQYRENAGGSGAAFSHNGPPAHKYAILYSGRPDGNTPANPGATGIIEARLADLDIDAKQIVTLWNQLTAVYNYAPANIQVLFGNGGLPLGAPANMRGRVVAASLNNFWAAINNLAGLTNNDQLFFFANDHGVARNDAMPPNAYLLVPRTPSHNPNWMTNLWLPASPAPSPGAPQGLERYSTNSTDPFLGWATDTNYVVGATITNEPQSQAVEAGGAAVFTVGAYGTAPLSYQWMLDGLVLANATNSSLTVSNADLADFGAYTVLVGNDYGSETSSIAMLFIDGLEPVAGNLPLVTSQNVPVSLTTSQVRAYAYDPDGEVLSVSAVETNSVQGGSVMLAGGTVNYAPPTNYYGYDSFTYTVSDGNGGGATGAVNVTVLFAPNISCTLLTPTFLPNGSLQVEFVGTPGCPYGLQRATVLTGPWTTLTTVTADHSGNGSYVDTNLPPGGAFYRTIFPP